MTNDEKMLDKVRKLLSKAERAGSEHEAEAFTAKATELMLKYAIDEAMLQARGERSTERVVQWRVEVSGYAKAKLDLMHRVANGLGLKSVEYSNDRRGWSHGAGLVVGWESDVESFKVLFASLQMQATHEAVRELDRIKAEWPGMRRAYVAWRAEEAAFTAELYRMDSADRYAARQQWNAEHPMPDNPGSEPPHGRSFMQSFLIGYGGVVGRRLYKQRQTMTTEAEAAAPGTAIALRDRGLAVQSEFDRLFPPSLLSSGGRGATSSGSGFAAGRAAGDRANLGGVSLSGGRKALGR